MDNSHQPDGIIADELESHDELAHQYFEFLQVIEPVQRWQDVVALDRPIDIDKAYAVDWESIDRLAAVCPALVGVMRMIKDQNAIAPRLGLRYAWSRFSQHAHLLDAVELLLAEREREPNVVLEPGCFTGGLLHFLANQWVQVPHIGFDVSPVALDVCSHFSDLMNQENRPIWLEADFTQITSADLPAGLGERISGGLVILSNIIEQFGRQFEQYPYLEPWGVKACIISYWVNQGAVVVLCERHDDPETLVQTIVEEARWDGPGCTARILNQFEALSTTDMTPEDPLGRWEVSTGCTLAFLPPEMKKG